MSSIHSFPSHNVPQQSVAVVDEFNYFIRWTSRQETHQKHLPHRSIQALILTSQNHLVIQKRHPQKRTYANHWDISSSGHVERIDYVPSDLKRLDQEWLLSQKKDRTLRGSHCRDRPGW